MSLILPPLPLLSPPPATPSPSTNSSDTSPPPSTPSAPPPSPPQESPPVESSPPSSPPVVSSPPPAVVSSPPPTVVSSPPPPVTTSPPPSSPVVVSSPPPQPSPSTPVATPPTPSPPAETPPTAKPSPSTPAATPPPSNPANTPPPSTPAVKPPPVTSTPPPTSLPANPSPPVPPTALPEIPKEKPTARPTGPSTNNRNSTLAASASSPSSNVSPGGAVAIGIVVGLVLLSLLLLGVWFNRRRKRKDTGTFIGYTLPSAYASPQGSDIVLLNSHSSAPKTRSNSGSDYMYSPSESGGVVSNQRSVFSYDELSQSTNGFSEKNLLGEGGFGCVYKGVLGDGRDIAVKQLKIGGSQGEREFRAEVEIISRVHHRHLVTLVGYCISEQHRLLVYDYVPNNTLHFHLHAQGRPVMTWETRVKVATGAARGIAYLHEDCHPRIIHRDIKSSNILLDNSFEALVADFGLAKIAQELDLNTHVSTRVMGTFGYLAPEYAQSGKLSEKSDVYSYGVILLELITGRIPVDTSQPLGDESLVEWARPLLNRAIEHAEFDELVDPRLGKKYVPGEMFRMVEAAAACVRHSAAKRPKMSQVVRALDALEEATDITNGMKPGQSQMIDSRQQSAQLRMFQRMAFGTQDYTSDFFDRSQHSRESQDQSRFIP